MRESPEQNPVSLKEQGQAVVEYILMLVLAVSIVTILAYGFRKSIMSLWVTLSREVAAACPRDCPPNTTQIR
jgi:hypothetical protein